MQEYEVKRGHAKNTDLKQIFELAFGTYREEDGWLVGAFGAMKMIKAKYSSKGDKLIVDTQSDQSIAPRVAKGDQEAFKLAQETQRRWNDFLETANLRIKARPAILKGILHSQCGANRKWRTPQFLSADRRSRLRQDDIDPNRPQQCTFAGHVRAADHE